MLAMNTSPDNTWVIDSGASHHMCNNRDMFLPHTITKTNYTIRLGDKTTVEAIEQGLIPINNFRINALFVPRFRISLLSVSKLDSELQWFTSFAQSKCTVQDATGREILRTPCSRGLYKINLSQIASCIHTTGTEMLTPPPASHTRTKTLPSSEIWHRRLAHPNQFVVKQVLAGRDLEYTTTDENDDDQTCKICIVAKLKQRFNRLPVQRSQIPFELVHSDLCGPMASSIGGANYYIIYVDDCTRYVEVFTLITKTAAEIVEKFKAYKAWVEAQGYRIRRFRCDNGTGEYANSTFLTLLTSSGISFEPAPAYTQHKNGVSERMIQTLNTKARCLLLDAQLPAKFWAEAIKTAAYIHRRTPTTSLPEFKTPFEALYGTVPPLHHLRRFGCAVFRHIPKEQRKGKFAERARPCMLLGYVHKTTKIYRIWDFAGRGRALESSNIRFVEHENAWTTTQSEHAHESDETLEEIFPPESEHEEAPDTSAKSNIPPRSSGEPPAGEENIPPRGLGEPPACEGMPTGNVRCTYHC